MNKYRRYVASGCLRSAVVAVGILLSAQEASAESVPRYYWNVFNFEEESDLTAQVATYSSLTDMLLDTNRTGVFAPNSGGSGANIIGGDSDGQFYWNVFNFEEESGFTAQVATYSSLTDMLLDTNRIDVFAPNTAGSGANIVGSGSDGQFYWNVFNFEEESDLTAQLVTYSSLTDMLLDTNRIGVFAPNGGGSGANIIGSGAVALPPTSTVPEPISMALLGTGLAGVAGVARRKRRKQN